MLVGPVRPTSTGRAGSMHKEKGANMILRTFLGVAMVGIGLTASDVRGAQQLTCDQIVAVKHFAGGKMSDEELATKLHSDADTVRKCLERKIPEARGARAAAPATK